MRQSLGISCGPVCYDHHHRLSIQRYTVACFVLIVDAQQYPFQSIIFHSLNTSTNTINAFLNYFSFLLLSLLISSFLALCVCITSSYHYSVSMLWFSQTDLMHLWIQWTHFLMTILHSMHWAAATTEQWKTEEKTTGARQTERVNLALETIQSESETLYWWCKLPLFVSQFNKILIF